LHEVEEAEDPLQYAHSDVPSTNRLGRVLREINPA
jgi:hypothetical protein